VQRISSSSRKMRMISALCSLMASPTLGGRHPPNDVFFG
jgi:hypothetical protein